MTHSFASSDRDASVIDMHGRTLPEVWERSILACWEDGRAFRTEYDKPEDPPSRDCVARLVVLDPMAEPRIHKAMPAGLEDLEIYRQEVLYGAHDNWIDPAAGKWTYTYHERLFSYCPVEDIRSADTPKPFEKVNQIQYIIDYLSQAGHSRRAQAITWMPTADPATDDPPCLQRIWCRLLANEAGELALNMNTHWRSRDLYKAWFMNVYALTDLQRAIADGIARKRGEPVRVGRYVDISDSLHIYGSYFDEVEPEIEKMRRSPFTARSWDSSHPAFEMMTTEAREKLARDPDWYAKPKR